VFLQLPFNAAGNLQRIVLILNTVLLLAGLVALELVYSERPAEQRSHLKLFIPLMFVLIGLLVYAAYRQTGK
jgi:hypothetical protein